MHKAIYSPMNFLQTGQGVINLENIISYIFIYTLYCSQLLTLFEATILQKLLRDILTNLQSRSWLK